MSSMRRTVDKAKRLIADTFDKHAINSGLGAAAMAELLIQMAVHEQISKREFLISLGSLYDTMSGEDNVEGKAN